MGLPGMIGGGLAGAQVNPSKMRDSGYIAPTYTERVLAACAEAEQRAADLKRVRELLERNPELEELLTILGRVHV